MSDQRQPLHIRVFLSSPGDVTDERSVALQVLERVQYDPLLRGQITVEVVAWDKPGADTPMLATMTPQEAINLGLPTPAVCDIVVVIFWARMGTPLPDDYTRPDGSRYQSGTAWEYENAMQASRESGRPLVVVYRRMQDVSLNPRDAQFAQRLEQWQRVEAFFAGFVNPDGSIRQGYNQYQTPDDFRAKFETHLKSLIKRLLDETPPEGAVAKQEVARLWEGSPFPGLRAFTAADAPIFFGRGAETDALVRRLNDPACRLVAVVGASGSGKSSLVGAGLIPRLAANAIEGSRDWLIVRFTPGELASGDPFEALAVALVRDLPTLRGTPARDLTHRLHEQAESLGEIAQEGLADRPAWAELVLFIDQFEELFSLVRPPHVAPFIERLAEAARAPRLRVVLTLRADFYAKCVEYPKLADLLETTTYPLAAPEMGALYEMVARPADLAGLMFEDGLVNRVLDDTGTEPGALALMAYALDELYRGCQSKRLTHVVYQALGGVQGAIGKRAESTFAELTSDAQASLPDVFREIAEVDERGVAIRRRAGVNRVARTEAARRLVDALTGARLLVQSRDEAGQPVVEVAHEALLRSWARLAAWIEATQDDLRLLRQVRLGADYWHSEGRNTADLLTGTRLEHARFWLPTDTLTPLEREFLEASAAEQARRQQAEQDAQARELEMQREIAEKRRQSANRLRYLAGVMAVFLVVTLMLSLFAFDQRNEAQNSAATAENSAASLRSLALVTSAEQALAESDPDLAVALAVQANRLDNPPADAVRVLYEAAYAPHAIREFESNGYIDVALSPDGKTAFGYFSGQENGLYLWDMETGERLRSAALGIPGITDFGVSDLAISADGRRAALIGYGGLVMVWDIKNWQQIAVLNPESVVDYLTVEQDGFGVAINADGSEVLAGVFGALIRWDVDSGEAAQVYFKWTGEENPVLPQLVEWSPDNKTAFIASYNSSEPALLIDLETGEIVHDLQFEFITRRIVSFTSAAFSADGRQLITGYEYYGAIVWDVAEGTVITELSNAGGGSVGAVAVSPDGQLYAVANGAKIEVWTISGFENDPVRLMTLPQPDLTDLTSLAFRPDNQTLLAAYESEPMIQLLLPAFVLWRVASDGELASVPIPASIRAYSPDGCCGLYFSGTNELHEIDLNTGEIVHMLERVTSTNVIYSGDGRRVLIGGGESGQLLLWNLETNTSAQLFEDSGVESFVASPDGRYFAVQVFDAAGISTIVLITKDGETVRSLDNLSDTPVSDMMFSPDSKRLMATTTYFLEDMIVWDVTTGAGEIRTPNFSLLESTSINFRGINAQTYPMPDGRDLIIIPDESDMLRVDTVTGAIETTYVDSNRDIFQIVMNDQVIVGNLCLEQVEFACNQAGLRIWDAVTGAQLAEIPVDGVLDSLQLGKSAIYAQAGYSLYRYRLEMPLQLIERLEQEGRIRPFTPDECRRFALDCDVP